MNHKQKLSYTVLGAVIMLVGLGLGTIVSPPLIAQKYNLFDEIRCNRITVVDKYDKPAIILSSDEETGNGILLFNQAGKEAAILHTKGDNSSLGIFNQAGITAVSLGASEKGSSLMLSNEEGKMAIALLVVKGLGRLVTVSNEEGKAAVELSSLNEFAINSVTVRDTAGKTAIELGSNIRGTGAIIYDAAGNARWEAP